MDGPHQTDSAEKVLVVAHQVHLSHSCQSLLLCHGRRAGLYSQAQAAHPDCSAADDNHPVPCIDLGYGVRAYLLQCCSLQRWGYAQVQRFICTGFDELEKVAAHRHAAGL